MVQRQSCDVKLGNKGLYVEDRGRVERETMIMEVEDGGGLESKTTVGELVYC